MPRPARRKTADKSVKPDPDQDQEERHSKRPTKKHGKTEPFEVKENLKRDTEPDTVREEYKEEKGSKGKKDEQKKSEEQGNQVRINRAPVLTLWVSVVAQKEGYKFEEGLTFGKYIAGVCAYSKGKRLGFIEEQVKEQKRKRKPVERFEVFGMKVPGVETTEGLRLALQNNKPISPQSVESYLKRAFGSSYSQVKEAMGSLACKYSPNEVGKAGYKMYEKFRPQVPSGQRGWGAKGVLDLNYIHELEKEAESEKK